MFQFTRLATLRLCIQRKVSRLSLLGYPIRKSTDHGLLATSRGFSQLPTSFIASRRQGIHRAPLVAFPLTQGTLQRFKTRVRRKNTFALAFRPRSRFVRLQKKTRFTIQFSKNGLEADCLALRRDRHLILVRADTRTNLAWS